LQGGGISWSWLMKTNKAFLPFRIMSPPRPIQYSLTDSREINHRWGGNRAMTVNHVISVRRISSLRRLFGSMFCAICWSSVTQTMVREDLRVYKYQIVNIDSWFKYENLIRITKIQFVPRSKHTPSRFYKITNGVPRDVVQTFSKAFFIF